MEPLKHECGIALVRLLKPLSYYQEKYGTWMYGLNKLYLLMEKQHNRGQEGAGFAAVKQHAAPGEEYLYRQRAEGSNAIAEIFSDTIAYLQTILPSNLVMLFSLKSISPLRENATWVTSVTLQRARAVSPLFIR